MVKHFDSCCSCATLRTGTIIIGVLGILGALYYIGAVGLNVSTKAGKHSEPAGGSITRIIMAIIGVVELILNAVLIYGAVKNLPKCVRPWVLVTAVLLVVGLVVTVVGAIILCVNADFGAGIAALIGAVIAALIQVYCILIVHSFHTTLVSGDRVATQTA